MEQIMKSTKQLFKNAYRAIRASFEEDRMVGFNGEGQAGVSSGGWYEAYSCAVSANGGGFHDTCVIAVAKAATNAFCARAIASYRNALTAAELHAAEEHDFAYDYI